MENVIVRPTNEQIENATEIIQYQTTEINSYDTCPIGLTPFDNNENVIRIKHCGHIFKEEILRSWFEQSARCPLCRYDIRDSNESNETNEENTIYPITHETLLDLEVAIIVRVSKFLLDYFTFYLLTPQGPIYGTYI